MTQQQVYCLVLEKEESRQFSDAEILTHFRENPPAGWVAKCLQSQSTSLDSAGEFDLHDQFQVRVAIGIEKKLNAIHHDGWSHFRNFWYLVPAN